MRHKPLTADNSIVLASEMDLNRKIITKAVGRKNIHQIPTSEKITRQKTKRKKQFPDQQHGKQKQRGGGNHHTEIGIML